MVDNGGERSTLARQGRSGGESGYACMDMRGSNPFYGRHGPPFIDKGVTTVANQSLRTD
jgi:hypothetical protein